LSALAELKTISKTLSVIIALTFLHDESKIGIAAIGGVEAVVKIMKTFPNCEILQLVACGALGNLASNSTGKAKAIKCGGIEVLLAAVNNHLDSAKLCDYTCCALFNIVSKSKENTGLLISLGGGAAVAKVRSKWPGNNNVQAPVRRLARLLGSEMKSWDGEEDRN
jgi:hypothetical protein